MRKYINDAATSCSQFKSYIWVYESIEVWMDCLQELRKTKAIKGKNEEGSKHKAYVGYLIGLSGGGGRKLMKWEAFKQHWIRPLLSTTFVCVSSCPLGISRRIPMINIPRCHF